MSIGCNKKENSDNARNYVELNENATAFLEIADSLSVTHQRMVGKHTHDSRVHEHQDLPAAMRMATKRARVDVDAKKRVLEKAAVLREERIRKSKEKRDRERKGLE